MIARARPRSGARRLWRRRPRCSAGPRGAAGPTLTPAADQQRRRAAPGRGTARGGCATGNGSRRRRPWRWPRPARPTPTVRMRPRPRSTTRRARPRRRSCPRSTRIVTMTAAGATTRNAVRPHGLGASNAIRPTAHAAQSSTVATRAGAVDHPESASLSAAPAETGSSTQVRRAHHKDTNARSAFDRPANGALSYEAHVRHRLRARNGDCDRQPSAS